MQRFADDSLLIAHIHIAVSDLYRNVAICIFRLFQTKNENNNNTGDGWTKKSFLIDFEIIESGKSRKLLLMIKNIIFFFTSL